MHPLQSQTRLNHAVHGGLADIGFGDLHAEYKHTNRHEHYEANQADISEWCNKIYMLQAYTDNP